MAHIDLSLRFRDPSFRASWREALARRYPKEDDARMFVEQVGLNPTRIAFQPRADLMWFDILREATAQGSRTVLKVLQQALEESKDNELLQGLAAGEVPGTAEGPVDYQWQGDERTLEKVIGRESSLVPVSFLERGLRAAQAVVRICVDQAWATGFLVEPDLLVTNHHVLGTREQAASARVQFNCETTSEGLAKEVMEVGCAPARAFATSLEDDWTLVALTGFPAERFQPLPLVPRNVARGDRVNIIQHPGAQTKQLSFFHNIVAYADSTRVQYLTDTLPGSSGAPVFDREWRVVALHHSGGWITEPRSQVPVYRNEGIRIDLLVAARAALLAKG